MRRSAIILKVSRTTIVRKLKFLGMIAQKKHQLFLKKLESAESIQFDDLHTSEKSKCLPVAITLMVESGSRKILNFAVSRMPANGHLSAISRAKYGFRKDERQNAIAKLFTKTSPHIKPNAQIISDEHPYYPPLVKKYFPHANYQRVKGRDGCIAGQGELKKIMFDPLFSLNHTCAMLRANINRLFRRTWCTTKSLSALVDHLAIYVEFHNSVLTN